MSLKLYYAQLKKPLKIQAYEQNRNTTYWKNFEKLSIQNPAAEDASDYYQT